MTTAEIDCVKERGCIKERGLLQDSKLFGWLTTCYHAWEHIQVTPLSLLPV